MSPARPSPRQTRQPGKLKVETLAQSDIHPGTSTCKVKEVINRGETDEPRLLDPLFGHVHAQLRRVLIHDADGVSEPEDRLRERDAEFERLTARVEECLMAQLLTENKRAYRSLNLLLIARSLEEAGPLALKCAGRHGDGRGSTPGPERRVRSATG